MAEIKRVARPGALIVIGVPGYDALEIERQRDRWFRRPIFRKLARRYPWLMASTPTLHLHNYPGDYYRFSPQAMLEVLLDGCQQKVVETVMLPPRIIGVGRMVK